MDWTESEVRKWLSNAGWTENEGFWWHPATDPSGRNENDLPAILASFASEVERLTRQEEWVSVEEPASQYQNAIHELVERCQQTPIHKQNGDFFRDILRKWNIEAGEWVSVGAKEQLPEVGKDVGLLSIHGWQTVGKRILDYGSQWRWKNHADFPTESYTHWRPLPSPPLAVASSQGGE